MSLVSGHYLNSIKALFQYYPSTILVKSQYYPSCSIASECLVNVQGSCMRNHDQIFVTYVQGGSRAGPIVVINDQWGE